jgi:hypothetical protein
MKKLEDFYTRFENVCSELDELSRQSSNERKASDSTRSTLSAQHENDSERFAAWEKRIGGLEAIICDLPTRAELMTFLSEVRQKAALERAILEHLRKLSAVSALPSTPPSPPQSATPPPPMSPPPLTPTAIPLIRRTTLTAAGPLRRPLP